MNNSSLKQKSKLFKLLNVLSPFSFSRLTDMVITLFYQSLLVSQKLRNELDASALLLFETSIYSVDRSFNLKTHFSILYPILMHHNAWLRLHVIDFRCIFGYTPVKWTPIPLFIILNDGLWGHPSSGTPIPLFIILNDGLWGHPPSGTPIPLFIILNDGLWGHPSSDETPIPLFIILNDGLWGHPSYETHTHTPLH